MSSPGPRLFEAFCTLRGIWCGAIPEATAKRPDYELRINGQMVIVEVKTLEPNPEERVVNARRARGEIVAGGGSPGERLRREIRSANKQLKAVVAGRPIPTMLVVFNNSGCGIHTDAYSVMTAMQGLDVIDVSVPADPALRPTFGPTHTGGEKAMRYDANTSTGAVAILHDLASNDLRLHVFHNRFAAMRLEPQLLRIDGIAQFSLPAGVTSSLEAPWAEVGRKR